MNRPRDWQPLRSSDPTPGDPYVVGTQARHHDDVAGELRLQVSRLRRIGGETDLRGQYADKLREAAEQLAGDLQQVERRYERVGAALRSWEPHLRSAQESADQLRRRAQALDAERRTLSRQHATLVGQPVVPDPTPAQQTRIDADQAAAERAAGRLDDIEAELNDLAGQLDTVVSELNSAGRRVAGEIRAAVDDDIADTTWENVSGAFVEAWRAVDAWIDRNIDWIKKVVEVLSAVGTVLGALAIFIPGLNLIVIALSVGMVLVQAALYASGNGSFTELALAVFAVATLGLGKLAGAVIKNARNATRAAAAPRAGARAAQSAYTQTRAARQRLLGQLGRRSTPARRADVQSRLNTLNQRTRAEAQRRSDLAEAGYVNRPPMAATRGEALLAGGDMDSARFLNDIARTQRQFPTADVAAAARWAAPALQVSRVSFAGSVAADFGSQALSQSSILPDRPYSQGFEDLKKNWDPLR